MFVVTVEGSELPFSVALRTARLYFIFHAGLTTDPAINSTERFCKSGVACRGVLSLCWVFFWLGLRVIYIGSDRSIMSRRRSELARFVTKRWIFDGGRILFGRRAVKPIRISTVLAYR